jgi:isocitrate dehydrogenase
VQKHYYKHLKGEKTSSNCMAILFAWTGALRKRGELDGTEQVVLFANAVEKAALATVESGMMTGDLANLAEPQAKKICGTEEMIDEIAKRLDTIWK